MLGLGTIRSPAPTTRPDPRSRRRPAAIDAARLQRRRRAGAPRRTPGTPRPVLPPGRGRPPGRRIRACRLSSEPAVLCPSAPPRRQTTPWPRGTRTPVSAAGSSRQLPPTPPASRCSTPSGALRGRSSPVRRSASTRRWCPARRCRASMPPRDRTRQTGARHPSDTAPASGNPGTPGGQTPVPFGDEAQAKARTGARGPSFYLFCSTACAVRLRRTSGESLPAATD